MELQVEWVVTLNRMHESINRRIGWILFFKAVEQKVPENEDPAVVLVDVLAVTCCQAKRMHG